MLWGLSTLWEPAKTIAQSSIVAVPSKEKLLKKWITCVSKLRLSLVSKVLKCRISAEEELGKGLVSLASICSSSKAIFLQFACLLAWDAVAVCQEHPRVKVLYTQPCIAGCHETFGWRPKGMLSDPSCMTWIAQTASAHMTTKDGLELPMLGNLTLSFTWFTEKCPEQRVFACVDSWNGWHCCTLKTILCSRSVHLQVVGTPLKATCHDTSLIRLLRAQSTPANRQIAISLPGLPDLICMPDMPKSHTKAPRNNGLICLWNRDWILHCKQLLTFYTPEIKRCWSNCWNKDFNCAVWLFHTLHVNQKLLCRQVPNLHVTHSFQLLESGAMWLHSLRLSGCFMMHCCARKWNGSDTPAATDYEDGGSFPESICRTD